jgi:2-polyprenyl-6-methoxyphenol hydroxylase-like FAD-dependent oxidoreductase
MGRVRIVIAGGGFGAALVAKALMTSPDVELFYFEKSFDTASQATSTGFNLNPNDLAALQEFSPTIASALRAEGAPRSKVSASDICGNRLFNEVIFDGEGMATTYGLRIRWQDAYTV